MITIEKALERLETFVERHPGYSYSDLTPAIQLGIEALSWINSHRDGNWHRCNTPLPGETDDNGGH